MKRYPLGPNAQAAIDEQKPGCCAICDKPIRRKAKPSSLVGHAGWCRRNRKTPYARARTCGSEECKYEWCQLLRADFRWRAQQARVNRELAAATDVLKARADKAFEILLGGAA